MKKRNERKRPSSCWNKAEENERLFVLLERDEATADTIRYWCQKRVALGLNKETDNQIIKALRTANKIDDAHRGGKYAAASTPSVER